MKRVIVIVVLLVSTNVLKADNWLSSFEEAQKLALATNKLILVDFWASWCGPCKQMDLESWSNNEVKTLMRAYVPVKIDVEINSKLATKYDVKGIPYIFIMDGNGMVLYKDMSYKTRHEVLNLLRQYALNMTYINPFLLNYHKNKSFASAYRVATKYSDFAVYLKENIKRNTLYLSDSYFNISKRLLKKSDLINKEAFLQQMDLFEIQKKLILNKEIKAKKELAKLKESNIDKINRSFYNLLNYVTCKKINDKKNELIWFEKLSQLDKKKAKLFFESS